MNLDVKEKIRIKLESFDHELLDTACKQIIEKIQTTQSKVVGPIPLPTKKRIYCVLRSPHVNKDSREHFEIRVHKRILDIYPSTINTAHSLININLPSGVTTTIK
jgi:small subunit ribosomal protein S10|tara:strand:+ start:347 stop:661 length:315 start_codon:yes stop_codon:yes gene_type:complete